MYSKGAIDNQSKGAHFLVNTLYDLWLLRSYAVVLEVMLGRIFAKFDIAP